MSDERLCVYCRRRPEEQAHRPFCSERCQMADLGRWMAGDYRVPSGSGAGDEDEPPDAAAAPPEAHDDERE